MNQFKMKKTLSVLIILIFISNDIIAQQTPGDVQKEAITLLGGTAHIGNGKIIKNSVIVLENGVIKACVDATTSKIPYKGNIINIKGQHVYPGFIAANTSLGLVEVDAVRASDDQREIGNNNPNINSLIAYNAESKVVESMRPNGVLIAQISPQGGRISGTSSIVQLDAWNWEDAAIKTNDGIHLNWPNSFSRGRWWLGESRGYKQNPKYNSDIEKLSDYFKESVAYLSSNKETINLAYESMNGLFDNSQTLFIHVDDEKGIVDAVNFSKNFNIKNTVIIGGYQAHLISDFLVQNNIPVLIQHTHSLPNFEDEDYNSTYLNPKKLIDDGVLVGIHTGSASNFQTRNLPFYAGQVAAQGVDKEIALQLITSNTAKILRIDKTLGTLEAGKNATLFVSKGDALDMKSNQLTSAYISGRKVSLETHQTELWKRYSEKYKLSN